MGSRSAAADTAAISRMPMHGRATPLLNHACNQCLTESLRSPMEAGSFCDPKIFANRGFWMIFDGLMVQSWLCAEIFVL